MLLVLILASTAGGAVYLVALRALSKEASNDVALLAHRVLPGVERLGRRLRPGRILRRQSRQGAGTPGPVRASGLDELARDGINGTAEVQSVLPLAEIATRTSSPPIESVDRAEHGVFEVVPSPEG